MASSGISQRPAMFDDTEGYIPINYPINVNSINHH